MRSFLLFLLLCTSGSGLAEPVAWAAGESVSLEPGQKPLKKNSNPNSSRAASKSSSTTLITNLAALVAVLLVFGGGVLIWKKRNPVSGLILPAEVFQVLGRRFIDQRHCVQIVRCGSRLLILSSSAQHGMQLLSEVTDPVEVDLLCGMCRQQNPQSVSRQFSKILNRIHELPKSGEQEHV